ncbi:AI-2E family transporter [Roseivirga echinicomitans]
MKVSLQKTAYALIILVLGVLILKQGGFLFIPLAFAFIGVSFYIRPVQWLASKGFNSFWSIFTPLITGTVIMFFVGYFMVSQMVQVAKSMDSDVNIENASGKIAELFNDKVPAGMMSIDAKEVSEKLKTFVGDFGMPLIGDTFKTTGTVLANGVLAVVFTFLMLLYRRGIADVVTHLGTRTNAKEQSQLLLRLAKTGQQYMSGLGILIVILTTLYTITFYSFGLKYSLVFAFIAATLAIIPYIGTTIGASLPVIYAYVTYDNHFIALGLIGCIVIIQALEGNFLTPKIVGGSMKLNPMASLMALVIGNYIWGLAGMILFLPLAAMARIVAKQIEALKPLAELSGDKITNIPE